MTWGPGAAGPALPTRWWRSGPRPEDVLLALGCAVLALVSLSGRISPLGESDADSLEGFRSPDGFGIALVILGTTGLLTMRSRPLLSLALVDTCMFALYALGYVPPPLPAAELVVLYTVASALRAVVSVVATVVTGVSIMVADLIHDVSLDDDKLVAYLMTVVLAWGGGYVVQVSRTQTRTAEENVRLIAEQQEVRTQVAVREEKERLTRELHDIVAHGLGVMVALAASGRVGARTGTGDAEQSLTAIEGTGRSALREMRTLMRDLGEDTAEPTPMLTGGALHALVELTRSAGLQVDLVVEGHPLPLPAGVDQAAFRVVQESLTNALRHSGAAHVQVHIDHQPTALGIRVRDDGDGVHSRRRAEDVSDGHGQMGMRRRIDLLGGHFDAHATGDGFEVVARIPVADEP